MDNQSNNGNIGLLNFLHVLNDGFLVSMPLLLPFISKDLSINLTRVGFLGGLLSSLSILLALPAGYIANKFGGLKVLIFAIFAYSIGYFGTAFAKNYSFLLLFFFIAGGGFGVFHPIAFALVSKWSKLKQRGKNMGNFTAVGDIGRILISSGITFLVVYVGWRNTSIVYAVTGLLTFLVILFIYLKKGNNLSIKKNDDKTKLTQYFKNPKFILANLTGLIDALASSSLFIFIPFLLIKKGVEPAILGSFTAVFFVGNFLGKSLLGRFLDKYEYHKVFVLAEILMAIFIFLLANNNSLILIIIFSIILGALTKGTVPVIQAMIADSITKNESHEKAFGLSSLIISISSALSPILIGFIASKLGIVNAFNFSAMIAILAIFPILFNRLSKNKLYEKTSY